MTEQDPRLALARAHRNQFLDAAEDAIAEAQRLTSETEATAARLAAAEALLRRSAETADAATVEDIRRFLGEHEGPRR